MKLLCTQLPRSFKTFSWNLSFPQVFNPIVSPVAGFSKQVKQKVSDTSLLVQTLEEEVTYTFTVRAQTIDYGPAVKGNVTTGPQEGSPAQPRDLALSKTVSSVELHWANAASGKGPILGYYFQSRRKGELERHSTSLFCKIENKFTKYIVFKVLACDNDYWFISYKNEYILII